MDVVRLEEYYKRLFPISSLLKWLGFGPSEEQRQKFQRREFSFTLQDDIYLRYQSYDDLNKFKEDLVKKLPIKIDIGGVYTQIPKDSKNWHGTISQVEERELVFDIDMTDYDDVRFCCSEANICEKCWTLMKFAIQIIDKALEEDFGFEFRFWVFSGRRGVHCWISDEVAKKLSSQARSSIAEYLTLVKGGENKSKKVNLSSFNTHPSIKRACKILQKGFDEYACKQQDFLGDEGRLNKFLNILPAECRDEFREKMMRGKDSSERWIIFQTNVKHFSNKKVKLSPNLIDEIMIQYCYPRLDIEVTKGMNHLLKSPFCIHPKTGMVCVPINVERLESFKTADVPTLEKLCSELETINMINLDKKIKEYKETSLRPYVELFQNFVEKIESKNKGKNLIKSDMACEW